MTLAPERMIAPAVPTGPPDPPAVPAAHRVDRGAQSRSDSERHRTAPTRPHQVAGAPRTVAHKDASTRLRLTSEAPRVRPEFKESGRPTPGRHLTAAQIEAIGVELDAMREEVMASRGATDAAYIRRVIAVQRWLELASRGVLLFSGVRVKGVRPAWWLGTAGLSLSKILENMEIGHNVMHGQWDWMRDPKIHSTSWEWDNASPSSQWKYTHNELHHTYTNVLGRDNDLGYGILRVDEDQEWTLTALFQPVYHVVNALIFQYGIAAYDLGLGGYLERKARGEVTEEERAAFRARARETLTKIRRQVTKDYAVHPLLALPLGGGRSTLTANVTANLARNLWTNTVIVCGHFPSGVSTFDASSIEGETRGEWYLRQLLGAANISGSRLLHIMTGNLSHQIEHHLFPDLPSNRYAEVAPKVRALMDRHDLHYITGPLWKQAANVYWRVGVLALPNREPGRRRRDVVRAALRDARTRGVGALRRPGQ